MRYEIDIKRDGLLPSIKIKKKDGAPLLEQSLATTAGALGGYGVGRLLEHPKIDSAFRNEFQRNIDDLYKSAGMRMSSVVDDLIRANRAARNMSQKDIELARRTLKSPFVDRLLSKIKEGYPYANAGRKFFQSAAEAKTAELLSKGIKKGLTPGGRLLRKGSLAVTGGILARILINKYYE